MVSVNPIKKIAGSIIFAMNIEHAGAYLAQGGSMSFSDYNICCGADIVSNLQGSYVGSRLSLGIRTPSSSELSGNFLSYGEIHSRLGYTKTITFF